MLEEQGATKLLQRGFADAANNDVFNDFEKWEDGMFWPKIMSVFGGNKNLNPSGGLEVEISTTLRSSHIRQDVNEAVVLKNDKLTSGTESPKRHLELKLPTDMTYRAGDYLAMLPINHMDTVRRVFSRFGLPWDASVTIKSGGTSLPLGTSISIFDVLSAYVELSQTATRRVSLLLLRRIYQYLLISILEHRSDY